MGSNRHDRVARAVKAAELGHEASVCCVPRIPLGLGLKKEMQSIEANLRKKEV